MLKWGTRQKGSNPAKPRSVSELRGRQGTGRQEGNTEGQLVADSNPSIHAWWEQCSDMGLPDHQQELPGRWGNLGRCQHCCYAGKAMKLEEKTGLVVTLDVLKGLFQLQWFHDWWPAQLLTVSNQPSMENLGCPNHTPARTRNWAWLAHRAIPSDTQFCYPSLSSRACWNCLCAGGEVLSLMDPAGLIQSPIFLLMYLDFTWRRTPGN